MDVEILKRILATSNDACWCMEFGMSVDLTAPDHEVVRQVFENDPFWRLSNPAMAQLYLLPAKQMFNEQPVSDIFPRNRQNEEFVRNLIANGFEADRAPALDTRYDGAQIYVENDVRAHIENGQLFRMFGTVRDIGKHQRREAELQSERDTLSLALDSVPSAVLAIDANGQIRLINQRAETILSSSEKIYVGQNLYEITSSFSGKTFASGLKENLEKAIRTGFPNTLAVPDLKTQSIWHVSARSTGEPIAAVITIETSSEGGYNG